MGGSVPRILEGAFAHQHRPLGPRRILVHWVNYAWLTIFFFVVGLEIKREIVAGERRDPQKAALPVMAALGGMIALAIIYW